MNFEKQIRKLARSSYWQFLYRQSKEYNDLGLLFENTKHLSSFQMRMLFWCERYAMGYEDLASKESIYLDEHVINHDNRFDAYVYKKSKIRDEELIKMRNEKESNKFRTRKGKIPEEMHTIKFQRGDE